MEVKTQHFDLKSRQVQRTVFNDGSITEKFEVAEEVTVYIKKGPEEGNVKVLYMKPDELSDFINSLLERYLEKRQPRGRLKLVKG
jgi:hypothetical protein